MKKALNTMFVSRINQYRLMKSILVVVPYLSRFHPRAWESPSRVSTVSLLLPLPSSQQNHTLSIAAGSPRLLPSRKNVFRFFACVLSHAGSLHCHVNAALCLGENNLWRFVSSIYKSLNL